MVKRLRSGTAAAAAITFGLVAGCSSQTNTAGFKAEQKPGKEEIRRQIEQIKANTTMPAGVKETALKKLEGDLAAAH